MWHKIFNLPKLYISIIDCSISATLANMIQFTKVVFMEVTWQKTFGSKFDGFTIATLIIVSILVWQKIFDLPSFTIVMKIEVTMLG